MIVEAVIHKNGNDNSRNDASQGCIEIREAPTLDSTPENIVKEPDYPLVPIKS